MPRTRREAKGAGLALAALLLCRSAVAQNTDSATAETLFEQGRDLLRAGKPKEACPKLAESQRLDPASGTLLALALCHEAEGKLASAWTEFVDVEARSHNENRSDREQVAHDHAQAIHPRLSTLEVRVPAEEMPLAGLEVRRDGAVLGSVTWNVALPVDGAQHSIEVSAPGMQPWKGTVVVKGEADAVVVTVPILQPMAKEPNPPATLSSRPVYPPPLQTPRSDAWSTLDWAGVGTAAAGVVGLGFGSYFLASALHMNTESKKNCTGDVCGGNGYSDRSSALARGNAATVFGIAGGALLVGGATLFVVGRTRGVRGESQASNGKLLLDAGPASLGARFEQRF